MAGTPLTGDFVCGCLSESLSKTRLSDRVSPPWASACVGGKQEGIDFFRAATHGLGFGAWEECEATCRAVGKAPHTRTA